MAMEIDRRLDGVDLCTASPLWLGSEVRSAGSIGVSVRIGLSREAHRKLRYFERDNVHVSGPRHLSARRRIR